MHLPTVLSPLLPKNHDPPPDCALCDLPAVRTFHDSLKLYRTFLDSFVRCIDGLSEPPPKLKRKQTVAKEEPPPSGKRLKPMGP